MNITGRKGFHLCSSKRFRKFSKKFALERLQTEWFPTAVNEIIVESLSRYSINRGTAKKMMGAE